MAPLELRGGAPFESGKGVLAAGNVAPGKGNPDVNDAAMLAQIFLTLST
jgi:hypothetical protein